MSFANDFEHRDALFAAALEEFITKGYEQASINTILNTAGMSKGQFYYHFQNKEGLYLALIEVLIARKREFLAVVMQPEDFQQGIFTIFETQVRHSMAFARQYPAINRFAESFIREQGNAIYKKALAIHNFEDNAALNQLIAAAYHRGDLRADLPLDFIQKTIGYLFTHVTELADLHEVDDFEPNLRHLITFMKHGLAGAAARPEAQEQEDAHV
jgi:TetR/AcrR family transcriptional regulator